VPKFYSDKKQSYILSNARYFDGIDKLRTWQDNYADYMQKSFKELQRGIKHSKMKHMDIKTWYSLINAPVNENDIKLLTAKAKNSELLEIKLKAMMKTLDAYKKYNTNALQEVEEKVNSNNKLNKDLKKTKEEKEVYKQVINLLAKHYNLNANTLRSYINTAENSSNNSNEKTR
jgi:hypothetical protein